MPVLQINDPDLVRFGRTKSGINEFSDSLPYEGYLLPIWRGDRTAIEARVGQLNCMAGSIGDPNVSSVIRRGFNPSGQ